MGDSESQAEKEKGGASGQVRGDTIFGQKHGTT